MKKAKLTPVPVGTVFTAQDIKIWNDLVAHRAKSIEEFDAFIARSSLDTVTRINELTAMERAHGADALVRIISEVAMVE